MPPRASTHALSPGQGRYIITLEGFSATEEHALCLKADFKM